MKKKVLLVVSAVMLIIDILLVILFWKNYMYYISDVDHWALGVFVGVSLVVEGAIFVLHITKMQQNLLPKILISLSLIFVIITFTYKFYNDSVYCNIDSDKVIRLYSDDKEYDETEIKEFAKLFNSAKYIKRNPRQEVVGTPDNVIRFILEDDIWITLDAFGDQIAVQVSGRNYGDSCYWMEQKDISKSFE